nr:hypothetical protein CFP56_44369 [Quercus suber]
MLCSAGSGDAAFFRVYLGEWLCLNRRGDFVSLYVRNPPWSLSRSYACPFNGSVLLLDVSLVVEPLLLLSPSISSVPCHRFLFGLFRPLSPVHHVRRNSTAIRGRVGDRRNCGRSIDERSRSPEAIREGAGSVISKEYVEDRCGGMGSAELQEPSGDVACEYMDQTLNRRNDQMGRD